MGTQQTEGGPAPNGGYWDAQRLMWNEREIRRAMHPAAEAQLWVRMFQISLSKPRRGLASMVCTTPFGEKGRIKVLSSLHFLTPIVTDGYADRVSEANAILNPVILDEMRLLSTLARKWGPSGKPLGTPHLSTLLMSVAAGHFAETQPLFERDTVFDGVPIRLTYRDIFYLWSSTEEYTVWFMQRVFDEDDQMGFNDEDMTALAYFTYGADAAGVVIKPEYLQPYLAEREAQIRDLLILGLPEKEIASKLGLSRESPRQSIKKIYKAYGVESRSELTVAFMQRGGSGELMLSMAARHGLLPRPAQERYDQRRDILRRYTSSPPPRA